MIWFYGGLTDFPDDRLMEKSTQLRAAAIKEREDAARHTRNPDRPIDEIAQLRLDPDSSFLNYEGCHPTTLLTLHGSEYSMRRKLAMLPLWMRRIIDAYAPSTTRLPKGLDELFNSYACPQKEHSKSRA
nr:hypothetical protein [Terriglobus albidus]